MPQYQFSPKEFCIWLSGFINASHHHNLTPEAWDRLKDALMHVNYDKTEDTFKYEYTKNQTTTLGPKKEILND